MIALRPATPQDARAIGFVSVTSWQQAYRGLVPDELLDSLCIEERSVAFEEFLYACPRNGSRGWLAHLDGAPVGFVLCGSARDLSESPGIGEVFALYVLKPHWGSGAGTQLFAQAQVHLASLGCPEVILWVLEANARARRFYEREGFAWDGGRKLDPWGGHTLDEVRYRRCLGAASAGSRG
jgi:ribosomal protein S18 acetylase RimI-like enzyme